MRDLEQFRSQCAPQNPEREAVSLETFRRLPWLVRAFYAQKLRGGQKPPSELAMRCLINDYLRAGWSSRGSKSVDGWKPSKGTGRAHDTHYAAMLHAHPEPGRAGYGM
jgi:hypothetical protein